MTSLVTLQQQMDRMEHELSDIKKLLMELKTSGQHMDQHIHFVEKVYQQVKAPATYVLSLFADKQAMAPLSLQ